jgi:CRISPR-associated protein Csd1
VATDGEQDQGGAFVRWLVESPGDLEPAVWRDAQLQNAWVQYNASKMLRTGLCMATGANDVALASSHPKRLRHAGDGAKLISSNDSAGFTFRGRFTDNTGDQACEIGFEASQKAHLALRWLIKRQAYKHADQAIVAWAVRGEDIPDPLADTLALFGIDSTEENEDYRGDSGQSYSLALKRMISGYRSKLTQNNTVIVMGLDAATPGRMAVTFYREFDGSEFLDRIESWHGHYAWHQNFGKEARFVGAASPRDIAQATYGTKVDDRLRKSTVERLLPCIVDARPVPRDILDSTVRRAAQRVGMEHWEWEKTLGIACGLYRGFHIERNYQMALEQDRTSRDYLYGRLLAIADRMESLALYMAKENRDTTAARLTHRFSDHPYSTWRTIEMALQPYKSRLRSSGGGSLNFYEKQIDAVCSLFEPEDFTSDRRLGGEFLLGYHCQRAKFYEAKPTDQEPKDDSQEDQ